MKKLLSLFALLILPSIALAQGLPLPQFPATKIVNGQNVYVAPIPNATITVCTGTVISVDGSICTVNGPLATIFSNASLTTAIQNPTNADVNGNINGAYVASGSYIITISAPLQGVTSHSFPFVAGGGGGTPGAPLLSQQANVANALAGLAGSSYNTITGALTLSNTLFKSGLP